MKDIDEILKFAEEAHKGQIRKFGKDKGKPYIIHPMRVSEKARTYIQKQAALLHDVIEDGYINGFKVTETDLTYYDIDERVINIVVELTRKDNETYFDFIMRIKENSDAKAIKILDIEDNLTDLTEGTLKDKYRLSKWILEH